MINKNIVIGVVLVAVIGFMVLYSQGYLDDLGLDGLNIPGLGVDVPDGSTRYDDNNIYLALVAFTGKALDRETIFGYIDTLDLSMWGINGQDQTYIGNYYKSAWVEEGYTLDSEGTMNGALASSYIKVLQGKGLLAKSGPMVQVVYGSDVVWIFGHGSLVTWGGFITYLST